MPTLARNRAAGAPDAIDAAMGGEDQGIDQAIIGLADEIGISRLQADEIAWVAQGDAGGCAQRLRAQGLRSVLIDTSPRPQPQAMALDQAMAARYVPLPQGQAADVHAAVAGAR